ncbi:type II toxin-antitoxin system HicB family antitoxin [Aurantimonas sp. CSK15Z-1]|nr:type II toxin-antitoxin system HicB family antitoxin [Aurantimonas sp. CSK15Z-1]
MTSDRTISKIDGLSFDPSLYEVHLRPLAVEEGGGWFATIPALPGCMGDGETELDAVADVRSAAAEWADAALAAGETVPAPRHSAKEAAE